ncbi:MAG TPA: leucine--tRNA ligase [Anaerolineales bacterium]|nr:leucine--tRNA ligase [Anaerolineales bacterium]
MAATKKKTANKKTAVKKAAKKKVVAKKTVAVKETSAKSPAKKSAAKKPAPKAKTTTTKVAARKPVSKTRAVKTVVKKKATPAKKSAAKKPAPKAKTTTTKVAARKPVGKAGTAKPVVKKKAGKAAPAETSRAKRTKRVTAIAPAPPKAVIPHVDAVRAVIKKLESPKSVVPVKKEEMPVDESRYRPDAIEKKWQEKWEADKLYRSAVDESRPKHYALTMLPYPSGDLHIGHWYAMTPSDARARFMRMKGFNVLFPMGFDAFGLPAENAAIKDGIHPMKRTYANIERMRLQMRSMGAMFDWEREAATCDPEYYRWTQWFFIKLYKMGLAYRKMAAVDWCPNCNTTLAREQVWGDDRHCERCGTPVIKKDLEQWFFRTTRYADELLNFDGIDWPERVKTLQTNWIGRSEGAEVQFPAIGNQSSATDDKVTVFTTRPDTLWGATFMVFSPEHPLVDKVTTDAQRAEVEAYKAQAARQSDIEREAADKEKTGVFTGGYAINPVNGERIPIWIADYVLMSYGTGAIMAVPAHDERDFAFAKKYGLPIIEVIRPETQNAGEDGKELEEAYDGAGVMVNSGPFNGTEVNEEKGRKNPGIRAVIDWLEQKGIGRESVNYRYRDWLISRQRYWGAPIPMVYCETHGWNPVPEDQLPVELPEDVEWRPTGESPLKLHPTWKNTACPVCGGPATRETDTMDTFMCSSWYHLRYLSPHYDKGPFDEKEYNYWMPVDTYTGGIEHATMHLLYTRFFHKAMRDGGVTEGNEPMLQLRNQGMVLGEDNDKMSKSKGNVIAPDLLVRRYGADTVRAYIMFFARWDLGGPWDSQGIEGTARWIRRVWTLFTDPTPPKAGAAYDGRGLRRRVHQTLRRVTHDFENFEFNTVVSSLMELLNEMHKAREAGAAGSPAWDEAREIYLKMMAPVAPFITEELWARLGKPYSIHQQKWPQVDEAAAREDVIEIPVQVNGKVRDRIVVAADAGEEEVKSAALASDHVQKFLEGREPKKVIVVKGKMVSVVA